MKVLSVASEVFPLIKTGGLADVAGALPAALKPHGIEMLTMLPGYPKVMEALGEYEVAATFTDLFGGPARLLWGTAGGLDVLVLEADHHYKRAGSPYLGPDGKDWPDNALRFAALSSAAAAVGRGIVADFLPALIHCHDWQAGLVPAYVRFGGGPRTVMTVHNLAFQGHFPYSVFGQLGLPDNAFSVDGVEYFGGVGYLKAGLQMADAVTTVSPTYAREILEPAHGMALDGVLRARGTSLLGIVNGIDTEVWNPATDLTLASSYNGATIDRRLRNKKAVEERFGLVVGDGPLFCIISRLTTQKGMDIMADAIPFLVRNGGRLAVLGSGDAALEARLKQASEEFPRLVGLTTSYDEALSHLLQGGSDAILVPSRFEPCGLTQLYGLRYGCIPVVARVGGLADTVIDANEAALSMGVASGIQFSPVTQEALEFAILRAIRLYAEPQTWRTMQQSGMKADVSWKRSAGQYAALYNSLGKTA